MSIRVVIADDQAMVRAGFRSLLNEEPDIDVVGEAADGEQAIAAVRRFSPDVVLMDIRMPNVDGLEATRRIVAEGLATRVLILTTFDIDEYVYEGLRAGSRAKLSTTRRVTLGARTASPSSRTWMAAISCSGDASLSRNPLAPARSPS